MRLLRLSGVIATKLLIDVRMSCKGMKDDACGVAEAISYILAADVIEDTMDEDVNRLLISLFSLGFDQLGDRPLLLPISSCQRICLFSSGLGFSLVFDL